MSQKWYKRCIGLQFFVAVALVTTVITAFVVSRYSKNSKAVESSDPEDIEWIYRDSQNSTALNTNGGEVDEEDFVTKEETLIWKDDDFISTIELPQVPAEVTPRLDEDENSTQNQSSLRDKVGQLNNIKPSPTSAPSYGPTPLATETPTLSPSGTPTILPSVAPSLEISDRKTDPEATLAPTSGDSMIASFDFLIADFVEGLQEEEEVPDDNQECPQTHEYSTACSDEMVGMECFYDYGYSGCTVATLSCSPMVECKCESPLGPGEGKWSCKENLSPSCNLRRSAELPILGEACDPNEPISVSLEPSNSPTLIPSNEPTAMSSAPPTLMPSTSPTSMQTEEDLLEVCPLNPTFGQCNEYKEGLHCDFEYVYKGCSWNTLQCSPAIQCLCSDGQWDCDIDSTKPCGVTVNGHPPGGVPWGEKCDPDEPIVAPEIISKKSVCPDSFSFGSCHLFEEDLKCEYNHAYKGCTMDEFACVPSITCECKKDSWKCSGDFENECIVGNGIPPIPEEYPWGASCDPSDENELETLLGKLTEAPSSEPTDAPTRSEHPTSSPTEEHSSAPTLEPTEKLLEECPATFQYGKCSDEYIDGLVCPYNYAYTGCSWEELACEASIQCKCDHWSGLWHCKSHFEHCSKYLSSVIPADLPWGESCDPLANVPAPLP